MDLPASRVPFPALRETSLHYVIDAALGSIFDPSTTQLDDIPKLIELVINCLSGLTNSAQHLKASFTSHAKALSSVTISSTSKLTAVLELINELDATWEQHDSKKLTALKDAIKRLDDSTGKASKSRNGDVSNTRVKEFLNINKFTRRRLEAVVNVGMMHYLLSNCTLSQIFEGLHVEEEALKGIEELVEQLVPEVTFNSDIMSGLDALKIVLPALSSQDNLLRKGAIHAVIDIVSSLDYVQGIDDASTEARTRFLYGPNTGLWRQLQFISSRRSVADDAEEPSAADTTVAGYFVDTRSDEERKGANKRRTFAGRRERLVVTFKVLSLMGSINGRDPEWAFASPRNCIRNFLFLHSERDMSKCSRVEEVLWQRVGKRVRKDDHVEKRNRRQGGAKSQEEVWRSCAEKPSNRGPPSA